MVNGKCAKVNNTNINPDNNNTKPNDDPQNQITGDGSKTTKNNTGLIAGVTVGAVVVVTAAVVGTIYVLRKRETASADDSNSVGAGESLTSNSDEGVTTENEMTNVENRPHDIFKDDFEEQYEKYVN